MGNLLKPLLGVILLLLLAGCQSYPVAENNVSHATLNVSQKGVPRTDWYLGDNPCFTQNEHSGWLINTNMFSPSEQQFNIKAEVPVYLATAAMSGACHINDKLKFTPQAGKVYDSKIDSHCTLSLVDHDTGLPPPDVQHISDNEWTFKLRPACLGYLPEK